MIKYFSVPLIFILTLNSSCQWKEEVGSKKNPIQISMIPAKDTKTLMLGAQDMADWLHKETGLFFNITIPTSYVAVVEAFGSKKVDVAYLNTTTYLMAKEKHGVEPHFISVNREGKSTYKGQFIARSDSKIKKIEDIHGKKMAFVDPTSASGFILPAYQLMQKKIKPKEQVFAGRHDAVVTMVYQKQVDAGATFYALPENGKFMDARSLVLTQFPDVGDKISVIDYTVELANDAFVFRKDLPEDIKKILHDGILKWVNTAEGKLAIKKLSNAEGLRPVTENEYQETERILNEMKGKVSF